MSRVNRRRRKNKREPLSVDALEQRVLLSGVNCCSADDQSLIQEGSASPGQSGALNFEQFDAAAVGANSSGSSTGQITNRNRHDWVELSVSSTSDVSLNLSELTGNLVLRFYDQDRNLIARSNRSGEQDESIQVRVDPGEYRIRVSTFRRSTSSYRLDWNVDPIDGAGNTLATANDLGSIGSAIAEDAVGPEDRVDVYRFNVEQRSELRLSLGELSADADLQLLNSRGQRLATSNLPDSNDELISGRIEAGTYYAVVTPWRDADTTYTFTADATPFSQTPEIPVDGGTDAFPDVRDLPGFNNWHLNAINAPEVWAQGYTGAGVLVAVVDTGVDLDHPDLASNIYVNPGEIAGNGIDDDGNGFVDDINGWDFTTNTNDANDINGHGTHVAGIIAAESNGFGATGAAYDATILPVQVLGDNGSGSNFSVADGIRYAVDTGADIINLSLGGGFSSVIQSAIRYAELNDVLVVAASGNESSDTPGYPARFSSEFSNTLSVGAFDVNERLAGFSNRVGNSGAVQVDAPGVSVYSTYPDGEYARLSGTSMAAPNAAAVAALALSANPDLSAAQLRTLVVNGAQESIVNSDSIGRVNAASTVALAAAGLTGGGGRTSASSSGTESSQMHTMEAPAANNYQVSTETPQDLFEEQPVDARSIAFTSTDPVTADSVSAGTELTSASDADAFVAQSDAATTTDLDSIDLFFSQLDGITAEV